MSSSSANSSLYIFINFRSLEFFLKRFQEFFCCLFPILVLPDVSLDAGDVPRPPSSGLRLREAWLRLEEELVDVGETEPRNTESELLLIEFTWNTGRIQQK